MSELQNALDIIRICAYRGNSTLIGDKPGSKLNREIINHQIRRLGEENISVGELMKSVEGDVRINPDTKEYIFEVVRDYYLEL